MKVDDCFPKALIVAVIVLLAALAAIAQDSPHQAVASDTADRTVRVFRTDSIPIAPIRSVMESEFKTISLGEDSFGVIGKPTELARAERMFNVLVQSMKQPSGPRQVQLLISVIGAKASGTVSPMPERLRGAVKELTNLFPYRGLDLLDETPVIISSDKGVFMNHSLLPNCSKSPETQCQQEFANGGGKMVGTQLQIQGFYYRLLVPSKMAQPTASNKDQSTPLPRYDDLVLRTSFEISPGQSIVLGKLNAASEQNAVFVVVTRLSE